MRLFLTVLIGIGLVAAANSMAEDSLVNDGYRVRIIGNSSVLVETSNGVTQRFEGRFTVLATERDPNTELRWGDWDNGARVPSYNVLSWFIGQPGGEKRATPNSKQHVEDGFDPGSDQKRTEDRTENLYEAAPSVTVVANHARVMDNRVEWSFPEQEDFSLRATLEVPSGRAEPRLEFHFTPKKKKWFSVGYTGAPEVEPVSMDEMWQPLIWQEKRFPNQPFLTEAARCPLPATLVGYGGVVYGVVADPNELPFMPMPTPANSRFGVAVRNAAGHAQPTLFAPILGGVGSLMTPGQTIDFGLRLVLQSGKITDAYEALARGLYAFHDYRRNSDLGSLNRTLERTVDYAMSEWARFNEDLRGCAYDTDVPGSVKNISPLHPLSLALVMDDERLFTRRARPMMEYGMSREKFLFTVNPEVTRQGASANLKGPNLPVSELAALYEFSGKRSPILLRVAEQLYGKTRTLNLDAAVRGDTWQNALAFYRATGERTWLEKAKAGADTYIKQRLDKPQMDFHDPDSRGMFFWSSYAPNWMELYELFDASGDRRYLEASREGARRFAQFVWMCPTIPDEEVLVNIGGKAPSYRKSDKVQGISIPEERVPAWRVSEIGLTCESSGTSKGHRGILLATHGPWMLRLAEQTGDSFLHDIGRSTIPGRYTSFPGYHMNTARTTVYEKPDFAQRPMSELNSTTSLHYNHIWPHAAMLLDYLVADAEYCTRGGIKFPSCYAEGYAYVQERVYGKAPGIFYGDTGVWLWMPKGLLTFDNSEINYVAGRSGGTLYLALMNQSAEPVSAALHLDKMLVSCDAASNYEARVWQENKFIKTETMSPANFKVEIAARGITALAISGVNPKPGFQTKIIGESPAWKKDYTTLGLGGGHAMVLNLGPELKSAYVYLEANGTELKQATLSYSTGGEWHQMTDRAFPFEFSVPLAPDAKQFQFKIEAITPSGAIQVSEIGKLEQ